jgi:hypothetical protein
MLASMGIVARSFEEPDELVTLPLVQVQMVVVGEVYVARTVHQPGWSWSEHVRPVAGTATCQHHHQGVVVSGKVEIEMEGGARRVLRAGEAFDIPPPPYYLERAGDRGCVPGCQGTARRRGANPELEPPPDGSAGL